MVQTPCYEKYSKVHRRGVFDASGPVYARPVSSVSSFLSTRSFFSLLTPLSLFSTLDTLASNGKRHTCTTDDSVDRDQCDSRGHLSWGGGATAFESRAGRVVGRCESKLGWG